MFCKLVMTIKPQLEIIKHIFGHNNRVDQQLCGIPFYIPQNETTYYCFCTNCCLCLKEINYLSYRVAILQCKTDYCHTFLFLLSFICKL